MDMGYGIRESRVRPPDAYGANKFFANQPVVRIACSYYLQPAGAATVLTKK